MTEIRKHIDLTDPMNQDNREFASLLDPETWDKLKAKVEDPQNEQTLDELVKEAMERG